MDSIFGKVGEKAGDFVFKKGAEFAAKNARKYPITTTAVAAGWIACGAPFALPVIIGGAGVILSNLAQKDDDSDSESE